MIPIKLLLTYRWHVDLLCYELFCLFHQVDFYIEVRCLDPRYFRPQLLRAPSTRTSEDCFIVAVFKSLSLHPFEQTTAVLLPCLQTRSLALIESCQTFVYALTCLRSEIRTKLLSCLQDVIVRLRDCLYPL
jgi:hypothetical protein